MSPEERARVPDRLTPPEEIAEAVVGFIQDDQAAGRVLGAGRLSRGGWCRSPSGAIGSGLFGRGAGRRAAGW